MSVPAAPFFDGRAVEAAVSPERALEAVREAFVAYARGEWTMPPTGLSAALMLGRCRRSVLVTRCSSG